MGNFSSFPYCVSVVNLDRYIYVMPLYKSALNKSKLTIYSVAIAPIWWPNEATAHLTSFISGCNQGHTHKVAGNLGEGSRDFLKWVGVKCPHNLKSYKTGKIPLPQWPSLTVFMYFHRNLKLLSPFKSCLSQFLFLVF